MRFSKKLLILGLALLSPVPALAATNCGEYVRAGHTTGAQNGESAANAWNGDTLANWQTAWGQLAAGEDLCYSSTDSGDRSIPTTGSFSATIITLNSGGSAGNYKRLIGVVDGTDTVATGTDRGIFVGNFAKASSSSTRSFIMFQGSADVDYIWLDSIRASNGRGFFHTSTTGRMDNIKLTRIDGTDFREAVHIYGNSACSGGAIGGGSCSSAAYAAASNNIFIEDVNFTGNTKNGIRFRNGVHNITMNRVVINMGGSAYGIESGNPPTAFNVGDNSGSDTPDGEMTVTDSDFTDSYGVSLCTGTCTYTQGDGTAFEEYVHDVTFTRCRFLRNTDGGVDIKGDNIRFVDSIFAENKRNTRTWNGAVTGAGKEIDFENCLIINAKKWHSTGEPWGNIHAFGQARYTNVTYGNLLTASGGYNIMAEDNYATGYTISIVNSIEFINSSSQSSGNDSTNSFVESGITVSKTGGTVVWDAKGSVTSGTDPQFISYSTSFTDFDIDMNSVLYAGSKGYDYTGALAGTGALSSTNVEPGNFQASTASTHTISFTLATALPATGKVVVTYPTSLGGGFTFNSGGSTAAGGVSGMNGTLSVSIASNVVTLTRGGGATETAADTACSFTLSNILNPSTGGSTGVYGIKTTDTSNNLIDEDAAVTADTITNPVSGDTTIQWSNVALSNMVIDG